MKNYYFKGEIYKQENILKSEYTFWTSYFIFIVIICLVY